MSQEQREISWHHVGFKEIPFESAETSYCKTRSAAMLVLCKSLIAIVSIADAPSAK